MWNQKKSTHKNMNKGKDGMTRREFLRKGFRLFTGLAISGVGLTAFLKGLYAESVWQIDPSVCIQCGRCAVNCVLSPSAVKCVHSLLICGYCQLCSGYFIPDAPVLDTGAENRLCPTGAIKRTFIEDPYYEYTIIEELCIGCGKCIKGCSAFGNGSLYLQIRYDRCVRCNECSIARNCPSGAIRRVKLSEPYLIKKVEK
jgi:electron transport complex protein RnfB